MTRSFHISALLFICALLLAPSAWAQLAVESIKTVTKQPPTSACAKIAARAFGEDICREAIIITDPQQKDAVRQAYKQQGLDPDTAEASEAMRKLEADIWDKGLLRKFGKDKIEPTAAEIDTYRTAFRGQMDQKQKDAGEISELITKLLAENTYALEDEQTMREILNGNDKSRDYYRKREEQHKEMPPEFQKMADDAERSIAVAVVKEWKRNKALFEEYGGRLALRNNRIEPVDADKKFMEWLQKEGKPVTLDADYRDLFGSLKRFIAQPHDFIPEKETDIYKNYYSSPDWILHFSQEKVTLKKNREILLGVPAISKKPKTTSVVPGSVLAPDAAKAKP